MDKSIIFNSVDVRGLLDNGKTHFRRAIKPQPPVHAIYDDYGWLITGGKIPICPYGRPGDHLWVKETWNDDWCDKTLYRADGGSAKEAGYDSDPRWRSSVHMPRKLSRFLLEIKGIRAERLQDISPAGLAFEGCPQSAGGPDGHIPSMAKWFADTWDDNIVEIAVHAWKCNPWVWVTEFVKI